MQWLILAFNFNNGLIKVAEDDIAFKLDIF